MKRTSHFDGPTRTQAEYENFASIFTTFFDETKKSDAKQDKKMTQQLVSNRISLESHLYHDVMLLRTKLFKHLEENVECVNQISQIRSDGKRDHNTD